MLLLRDDLRDDLDRWDRREDLDDRDDLRDDLDDPERYDRIELRLATDEALLMLGLKLGLLLRLLLRTSSAIGRE